MSKRLVIISIIVLVVIPVTLFSQTRSAFSGDPAKFRSELTAFMGPNMNHEQLANLNSFLARWDSSAFSTENMVKIIDVSSQLSSRLLRPIPHFNDYLITLNYFFEYRREDTFFTNWLTRLSEIAFSPRLTNENIDRYFKTTCSMIKENVLFESASVKWQVKNSYLKFTYDTVFTVIISDATLTCYTHKDSTEIYNVTGIYYPEILQFRGTKGIVTWEKAGYSREDISGELRNYTINTTKSSFTIDSARLSHTTYFKEPVFGSL